MPPGFLIYFLRNGVLKNLNSSTTSVRLTPDVGSLTKTGRRERGRPAWRPASQRSGQPASVHNARSVSLASCLVLYYYFFKPTNLSVLYLVAGGGSKANLWQTTVFVQSGAS